MNMHWLVGGFVNVILIYIIYIYYIYFLFSSYLGIYNMNNGFAILLTWHNKPPISQDVCVYSMYIMSILCMQAHDLHVNYYVDIEAESHFSKKCDSNLKMKDSQWQLQLAKLNHLRRNWWNFIAVDDKPRLTHLHEPAVLSSLQQPGLKPKHFLVGGTKDHELKMQV